MDEIELKEQIISEYLTGTVSLRKLAAKYGLKHQTMHKWILQYQGRMKKLPSKQAVVNPSTNSTEPESLPTDVRQLQAELRKAKLLNEVLTEVIKIAEEELGLPIRKKFGTKRS